MISKTDDDRKGGTILLVDDEIELLSAFKLAFKDDFKIRTASNALEAFEVFDEYHAEIDLVLSDQCMPGGQGIEFLQRVKSLSPGKPCFLITAHSQLEVLKEAINGGCVDQFISKPWDTQDLAAQIKSFIAQSKLDRAEMLSASMMALQAGTAGILQLGVPEIYGPYLRSIEVFTGAIGSYYCSGGVPIPPIHVNSMMNSLRECALSAIDVFDCRENAFNIRIGQSLKAILSDLEPESTAKNIRIELFICNEEPCLLVDMLIWHEFLKLVIRDELSYAMPNGAMNITVSMRYREGCVAAMELKITQWISRTVRTWDSEPGNHFERLAHGFAHDLLAKLIGLQVSSDIEGSDSLQKRTITAIVPADLISTPVRGADDLRER
ncbi:MAG: CheY-like chemotaxis protein [Verrucomicrobiales bacterium]|jgi:CheY-like chemotaxis protein